MTGIFDPCAETHCALEKLPKHFEPSDELPKSGVYFFYEKGQPSAHKVENRIVRVGTHGAKRALEI
jgi:hypothetical protein